MISRRRMLAATASVAVLAVAERTAAEERVVAAGGSDTAVAGPLERNRMDITRIGSQPSQKGSAEYFTGSVRIDSRFQGKAPARVGGALVTFEPGARTAWHTHPLGQTLIVTSGWGWVQVEGAAKEEIRPGDIVLFAPGEKHWHGATDTTAMTHIAIAEALDGKTVDWMEHVSNEQYRG
jgi:quercetin dioxygenase-like cupin family protein